MRSLDPPFLELAYFLGGESPDDALDRLVGKGRARAQLVSAPGIVGLSEKLEEAEIKGRTLLLRTEGQAFCGTFRKAKKRLKRLGRKAYARFVEVAEIVPCSYGAILVEYALEEPSELRRDPRSLAFRDCFVSRRALGQDMVAQVLAWAGSDAYVEEMPSGVYLSMTPEFNPEGRGVPPLEAQKRSVGIASVLAAALLSH